MYLVVTCRTGRAGLDEAVPEPLTFDEPLLCSGFMRMESSADFGQLGAARYIPVKLNAKPGAHTHNMRLMHTLRVGVRTIGVPTGLSHDRLGSMLSKKGLEMAREP